MYQSLHTAVVRSRSHAIEIRIPAAGRSAHGGAQRRGQLHGCKEGKPIRRSHRSQGRLAGQLMEWRDQVADAGGFVESMKSEDVFKEQIYIFTPAEDVVELPGGATPVDFAYAHPAPRIGIVR